MKSLPVPPLRQTLDRYLEAVQPLASADEFVATAAAVAAFADGDGPRCQRQLEAFAQLQSDAGHSWLAPAWLDSYLVVREPLPLSTSVAFLVNWPGQATGVARAADFVHRIASVHLAQMRGDLEPEQNARGEVLDDSQRAFLAGGMRHPRPGRDVIERGPTHTEAREIVVLWRGVPYAVPISDGSGQPLPRPALAAALQLVMAERASDESFAPLSYLGSADLAELLPQVLQSTDNAATYARLTAALFVVSLTDAAADEDAFLNRSTVGLGQTWAYKPATYLLALSDDQIAVHLEHSTVDGATLKGVIAAAQQVLPNDAAAPTPEIAALPWACPATITAAIRQLAQRYVAHADDQVVRTVFVDRGLTELPFRLSADAAQQWLMLYAQLATYGKLRSTYEAVDMREYQAGRTECLRPNTAAAVTLVQGLLEGNAESEHLQAALAAHKDWVKACKQGQGMDRHLLGLQLMAQTHGFEAVLHQDPGYARLTTDFLSTTSLGDPHQLIRFAFAPTSPGGLGISYGVDGDRYEFCISYRRSERGADVEAFIANLTEGGRRLTDLLGSMAAPT